MQNVAFFVRCEGLLIKDCWVGLKANPGKINARVVQHHPGIPAEVIRRSLYAEGYRFIQFA